MTTDVKDLVESILESDPDREFGLATAGIRFTQSELKKTATLAQQTLQNLVHGLSELDLSDLYKGEDSALRSVYAADATFRKVAPRLAALVDEFEKDTKKFMAVAQTRAQAQGQQREE